ncbi:uncharacterized protein B0H64DRAFT_414038 [Chaetomium fimeti]|uniref:Uncharacterized protein n=1 Tax=Chaetomium fimeti TaxID=1854472 RepID=A0AAE0LW48_9PEZI|nr:hypothetical protein B0H64DRAFT_414038 [Chaetomium fimeti]
MRALQKITTTLPRATALRGMATRPATVDTLRAHHKTSPSSSPATQPINHQPSNQGVFGAEWSSHFNRPEDQHRDHNRARASCYSTQIYHGQARPSDRRGIHSVGQDRVSAPSAAGAAQTSGPVTGAGTGVLVSAQMFGTEVKGNPTESEADVAADRSDEDPLPPGLHHTIRMGAGDAAPLPTESEADVVADRGGPEADPLRAGGKGMGRG